MATTWHQPQTLDTQLAAADRCSDVDTASRMCPPAERLRQRTACGICASPPRPLPCGAADSTAQTQTSLRRGQFMKHNRDAIDLRSNKRSFCCAPPEVTISSLFGGAKQSRLKAPHQPSRAYGSAECCSWRTKRMVVLSRVIDVSFCICVSTICFRACKQTVSDVIHSMIVLFVEATRFNLVKVAKVCARHKVLLQQERVVELQQWRIQASHRTGVLVHCAPH